MIRKLAVTLYLESWQKRMLKDFSKVEGIDKITRVTIKPGKGGCLTSYKIPPLGMRKDDWLIYLTDQQVLQVKEHLQLRTAISSVNITADAMQRGAIVFS
ncbi:MAG: hypothetical protein LAO31_10115 [Acidobacteriia bacterium]|nr:hypothetical protein [Terriglobia bacterium]